LKWPRARKRRTGEDAFSLAASKRVSRSNSRLVGFHGLPSFQLFRTRRELTQNAGNPDTCTAGTEARAIIRLSERGVASGLSFPANRLTG